jgi:O-antigen/teichoic acid export membrane protein
VAALSIARSVRPLARDRRAQVGRLLRMALPFAMVAAANVLYLRIDVLMLGHMDTETAVGNYGVVARVMDAAVILPAFFGNAFLATIAATGPRTERGRMQTTQALPWIVLLTAPLAVTLLAVSGPLMRAVTGGGYDDAGPILARLAPFVLITATYGVLSSLQVALDKVLVLMRLFLIGLVVKVAVNFWAIPKYGAEGAAVTAVGAELLVAVVQWYWSREWFDSRVVGFAIVRILVASVVSGVAMALLVHVVPWPLAILLGLIVYALAALATGALSPSKAREVLGAVRSGGAQPA